MQEQVVVIVGSGPSSLATAACLNVHSIPCIILQREDCYASLWKKYSYDRLHLQLFKQLYKLPHMSFPPPYPRFLSKNQFIQYFDDYVSHFKIRPLYRRSVELADCEEASKKWIVKARNLNSGEIKEYSEKFLVVAVEDEQEDGRYCGVAYSNEVENKANDSSAHKTERTKKQCNELEFVWCTNSYCRDQTVIMEIILAEFLECNRK